MKLVTIELIGMIIESPEIANTQRAIFGMIWEFSRGGTQHAREHSPLNGLKASDIIGKKVVEELAAPATEEKIPEPVPTPTGSTEMEITEEPIVNEPEAHPEPAPTESTEVETAEEPTAETPPLPEDLEEPAREPEPPNSAMLNNKEQIQLF